MYFIIFLFDKILDDGYPIVTALQSGTEHQSSSSSSSVRFKINRCDSTERTIFTIGEEYNKSKNNSKITTTNRKIHSINTTTRTADPNISSSRLIRSTFATPTTTTTTTTDTMSPSIELRRFSSDQRSLSGQHGSWSTFFRRRSHHPANYRLVKVSGPNKYDDNSIATAKYNIVTFVPKFLFEQFRKYANIFFLFIALMQQIPNVSPTGRYTTLVPLIFILVVSALKEMFEDLKRHRADHKVNNSQTEVYEKSTFVQTKWKNLRVGDIVRVKKGQFFPSDLAILTSNEPNGE